jgi:Gram-negative bacterial TonB protein C-terminal
VAPPPSDAPPGAGVEAGNAKTDVASVGLNPAKGPIPNGSRGGQFSRAPNLGEPASGEVSGAGVNVPGLAIQEDRSRPSAPPQLTHTVLYADKVGSIPVSTLSVPLRPASRTIPRSIDQRFRDRDVYTIVIPIENLPSYSGDWIMWFAERDNVPGDRPAVRAPIPLRKTEPLEAPLPTSRTEVRVQVIAIIRRDGKIEHVSTLNNLSSALAEAAIQDVKSWEFKPATRDGIPVPVDVIIEIPFSLPPAMAKHVTP